MGHVDRYGVEYLADSCVGCCRTEAEATDYLLTLASDPYYETVLSFVRAEWNGIAGKIEEKSRVKIVSLEVAISTAIKLNRN